MRSSVGNISDTTDTILDTNDSPLYQTQRWGKWTMDLPVLEGHYTVTIKTAEEYFDLDGARVMDIQAEGLTLAENLDLHATYGHDVAHDITQADIFVDDGLLTLNFDASVDNATASAVLITTVDGGIGERPPVESSEINGTYISGIECGAELPGNTESVYGPSNNFNGGWSHVVTNGAAEFSGLSQDYSAYQVNNQNPNSECGGENTLDVILVRKFHQWDHMHANGMQKFGLPNVRQGDIESIVIDLKLHSSSVLPTTQEVINKYPNAGSAGSLSNGMAVINLAFSDANMDKYLMIDPNLYLDEWIRIVIPIENMGNYNPGNVSGALLVDAELSGGAEATIQHREGYVGDAFYQEVNISLHRIAYVLKN